MVRCGHLVGPRGSGDEGSHPLYLHYNFVAAVLNDVYGIQARVTPTTAEVVDGRGLAGSTLTMIRAVQTAVEQAEIPLVDAVYMATLNPARQLGRDAEFG